MIKRLFFLMVLLGPAGLCPFLGAGGCGTGNPTAAAQKTPTPTNTPYGFGYGTINVNNACTGSCVINVWLDVTGPVTMGGGQIQTYSNVPSGYHTLVFNTTASVTCGAPVSCNFYYDYTGTSCDFYLDAGRSYTIAITDDGCAEMRVNCP